MKLKIKTTKEINKDFNEQLWINVNDLIRELEKIISELDDLPVNYYDSKGYSLISYSRVKCIISKLYDELISQKEQKKD